MRHIDIVCGSFVDLLESRYVRVFIPVYRHRLV